TRSTRFERATASVSAMAFIANRPCDRSMTAAAISVFYPRDIKRFLENLDFHGLATEQALQFLHSSAQVHAPGSCRNVFIRLDCPQATLEHSPARQLNSKLGATPARRAT